MRKFIPIAALLITQLAMAADDYIYRWKDTNGVSHYSDQPQPGAERIKANQRSSASAPKSSTYTSPSPSETSNAPVSREVAQQVRQEAATAKAEQCKKAEEAYQKAITARRIYKADEKGNRTFLSSEEVDNARLEARASRDLACSPSAP